MADMLVHNDPVIRERVCMALSVLGGLADGRTAIVHNAKILTNLSLLIDDPEEAVRMKAATCLEMVARFFLGTGNSSFKLTVWVSVVTLVTIMCAQLIVKTNRVLYAAWILFENTTCTTCWKLNSVSYNPCSCRRTGRFWIYSDAAGRSVQRCRTHRSGTF